MSCLKERCRIYGLTEKNFYSLLSSQKSKCQICGRPFKSKSDANIDHDHSKEIPKEERKWKEKTVLCDKTAVRGLLCRNCNLALGHAKDNGIVLFKMNRYLLNYKTKGFLIPVALILSVVVLGTSLIGTYTILDIELKEKIINKD